MIAGINVALGPVAGPLGRIARAGRNWEGLSSDPYLAGAGMYHVTDGMQSSGVIATAKVFIDISKIASVQLTKLIALPPQRARIPPQTQPDL